MTQDVKLTLDPTVGLFDLSIDSGKIESVDGLETSIEVGLFTDSRASSVDVPEATLRRGWVGEIGQEYRTGSTLWQLDQARLTNETMQFAKLAASASQSWMISKGVAKDVNVNVVRGSRSIDVEITYTVDNNVTKKYITMWRSVRAA